MRRFEVGQAEVDRIVASAKRMVVWDEKRSAHLARVAPSIQADADQAYEAVLAAQPQWVTIDGVDALQSPGSRFVAIPVSGRENSRHWHVIDLDDRTDIVCQLKKTEVYGWLAKRAIADRT